MRSWKIILWGLLAILAIIQLFRPARNAAGASPDGHISKAYAVPADVEVILQKACYDCHSNNTVYPWYANIQPVAWWLAAHIKDGKRHLNFDEFLAYPVSRQYRKLEETAEMVNEGEMPLSSYTIVHTSAKLDAAERKMISDWCGNIRKEMQSAYPPDSLIAKKKQ